MDGILTMKKLTDLPLVIVGTKVSGLAVSELSIVGECAGIIIDNSQ